MSEINKYKLADIELKIGEWELLYSFVFTRYSQKIHALEIGEGNPALVYALVKALGNNVKTLLSVDVLNSHKAGEKEFYSKKIIYNNLYTKGINTELIQEDFLSNMSSKMLEVFYSKNKINFLILEYLRNEQYMDDVVNKLSCYLDDKYDIYYHHMLKNKESILYFDKMSEGKKYVKLVEREGIGIIKNS